MCNRRCYDSQTGTPYLSTKKTASSHWKNFQIDVHAFACVFKPLCTPKTNVRDIRTKHVRRVLKPVVGWPTTFERAARL